MSVTRQEYDEMRSGNHALAAAAQAEGYLRKDIQAVEQGNVDSAERERIALIAAAEQLTPAEMEKIRDALGDRVTLSDERLHRATEELQTGQLKPSTAPAQQRNDGPSYAI